MSKRSPILGYNHNVRFRGLVFHVQTEDSGILSPHLFTHLFHHGVIVSTRKLVYDAGASEEVIKSLMQAQHKAVLKDLKKGAFDEKIDAYLGGTPGLLPRAPKDPSPGVDKSAPPAAAEGDKPRLARPSEVVAASEPPAPPAAVPTAGEVPVPPPAAPEPPVLPPVAEPRVPTAQQVAAAAATKVPPPRTMTQERTSTTGNTRNNLRAKLGAAIEAVRAATTIRTPLPPDLNSDLEPEIEIELELDDPHDDMRMRQRRDTLPSDTTRTLFESSPAGRMAGEPIPPLPAPGEKRSSTAVGAAALPPGRKIARPQARPAITPPQVVTRPRPNESDAVEVYGPPPPSSEPPPGSSERPGQHAQHKKISEKIPIKDLAPVPPVAKASRATQKAQPTQRMTPQPPPSRTPRPRTPTPPRASVGSGPRNNTPGGGGVVMTRPAVIVGAPPKAQTAPRARKAREDEGHGFGQGLISEKSLDEVILAYLSEDSDDK